MTRKPNLEHQDLRSSHPLALWTTESRPQPSQLVSRLAPLRLLVSSNLHFLLRHQNLRTTGQFLQDRSSTTPTTADSSTPCRRPQSAYTEQGDCEIVTIAHFDFQLTELLSRIAARERENELLRLHFMSFAALGALSARLEIAARISDSTDRVTPPGELLGSRSAFQSERIERLRLYCLSVGRQKSSSSSMKFSRNIELALRSFIQRFQYILQPFRRSGLLAQPAYPEANHRSDRAYFSPSRVKTG